MLTIYEKSTDRSSPPVIQNIPHGPLSKGKISTLAANEYISSLSRHFDVKPQTEILKGNDNKIGKGLGLYSFHVARIALRGIDQHLNPYPQIIEECRKYASFINEETPEAKKFLKEIRTIESACEAFRSALTGFQPITCEHRSLALFTGLEIDDSQTLEVQVKGNINALSDIESLADQLEGVYIVQSAGEISQTAILIRFGTEQVLLDQQGIHLPGKSVNGNLAENILRNKNETFHFFKLKEATREKIAETRSAIPLIRTLADAKNPFNDDSFSQAFKCKKGVAVISGAGIAGLAASIELRSKGFKVIVVEKRSEFSRFNIININKEAQDFLRRHNLLDEFELSIAGRIEEHQNILISGDGIKTLFNEDVSMLTYVEKLPEDRSSFDKVFNESGIYSVPIKGLQAFLAEKAIKAGVKFLADSEISIDKMNQECDVEELSIKGNRASDAAIKIRPDLLFIAEGAHSKLAEKIGMVDGNTDEVVNACTGENWIFGNIDYKGDRSFVISIIDASQEVLNISNVIFSGKSKLVNVATTVDIGMNEKQMRERIVSVAKSAFGHANIEDEPMIFESGKQPVRIINTRASICSKGNVFRIGDAAGSSSPLAGLGGTLNLTLVPLTISKLCSDYAGDRKEMHKNFKEYTQAYVDRWINKSEAIKKIIVGIFDKEKQLPGEYGKGADDEA